MTMYPNIFAVMKEHKDYLQEEKRKQADIDYVIKQADNNVKI